MPSCLGIFVDKNIVKYAKLKKQRNTYKVEAFSVEVTDDVNNTVKRVIAETNSQKALISLNVSNEFYNYFEVYNDLDKKDIEKSLDIEFEKICNKVGYDPTHFESRYILNNQNEEKSNAIYISLKNEELEDLKEKFQTNKLISLSSISTSIINLLPEEIEEKVAILNLENNTILTTIINGQIDKVENFNMHLGTVLDSISQIEMSKVKAYEKFKDITIYDHEVKNLNEDENEYLDFVFPVINNIIEELKSYFENNNLKIDKLYLTGIGATISNIDLYIQDSLKGVKCEILKPFFVDVTSLKYPIKEYIEVNSAIALALDGLGFMTDTLNFASKSMITSSEIEGFDLTSKQELKELFNRPYKESEKVLVRFIYLSIIILLVFLIFSISISIFENNQINKINEKIDEANENIEELNEKISTIDEQTNYYNKIINFATKGTTGNYLLNDRVIEKDEIPNLLNKIMYIIPQQVQINSLKNTTGKHIVINATSKSADQLEYFNNTLKENGILLNVTKSDITNGTDEDSYNITIEGDLS